MHIYLGADGWFWPVFQITFWLNKKPPTAGCTATHSWGAASQIHCSLRSQILIERDELIRWRSAEWECLLVSSDSSMSRLILYTPRRESNDTRVEMWEERGSTGLRWDWNVIGCDWMWLYLQPRPAVEGSLCSSPPHPAGRPPHSLCYPAATVAGSGEGEVGEGKGETNQEGE